MSAAVQLADLRDAVELLEQSNIGVSLWVLVRVVAEQLERGELDIGGGMDTESFVPVICRIKGVGEWTAQYIAMRALSDPSAFSYSDLIFSRAVAGPGDTLTPSALRQRAESWQPWRAYCAILLWKNYAFEQFNKPIKQ